MNAILFLLALIGQTVDLSNAQIANDVITPASYAVAYEWYGGSAFSNYDPFYVGGDVLAEVYIEGASDYPDPVDNTYYWVGSQISVSIEQGKDWQINAIDPSLEMWVRSNESVVFVNENSLLGSGQLTQNGNLFTGTLSARIYYTPSDLYDGIETSIQWKLLYYPFEGSPIRTSELATVTINLATGTPTPTPTVTDTPTPIPTPTNTPTPTVTDTPTATATATATNTPVPTPTPGGADTPTPTNTPTYTPTNTPTNTPTATPIFGGDLPNGIFWYV